MTALDMKTFKALFKGHPKKLALFNPRKDQCDTCVQHERGNLDEATWNDHRIKYQCAQEEKARNKSERNPNTLLISMDLQAVLLSASMQASALYYRTKLTVNNFTIFYLGIAGVDCYVWHEVEGGLTANEFCSCWHDYLTNKLTEGSHDKCIIYSDGCTYQNRNKKRGQNA
ncbi:hypothetical protein ElyMa_002611000 [Elysia marginata]|uniref:Uncharacterized protein n=1 Tax=Elysia marginata TaxID=1093978 RepID=A0AAV4H5Y7_9GAST|nr:hypothetical protein ElyMa_002611000 [Elysia marginata]